MNPVSLPLRSDRRLIVSMCLAALAIATLIFGLLVMHADLSSISGPSSVTPIADGAAAAAPIEQPLSTDKRAMSESVTEAGLSVVGVTLTSFGSAVVPVAGAVHGHIQGCGDAVQCALAMLTCIALTLAGLTLLAPTPSVSRWLRAARVVNLPSVRLPRRDIYRPSLTILSISRV